MAGPPDQLCKKKPAETDTNLKSLRLNSLRCAGASTSSCADGARGRVCREPESLKSAPAAGTCSWSTKRGKPLDLPLSALAKDKTRSDFALTCRSSTC